MSLIACPYCQAQVADQDFGKCPKCGGDYCGSAESARQQAAEREQQRIADSIKGTDEKYGWIGVVLGLGTIIILLYGIVKSLASDE